MASFGRIEEFLPEKETISNYLKRVEIFFRLTPLMMKRKFQFSSALLEGTFTHYYVAYYRQQSHRKRLLLSWRPD